MLHLLPETSLPEFTPNASENTAKRLAKRTKDSSSPPRPKNRQDRPKITARRTIRSLRSLLVRRDQPAARAIRELARYCHLTSYHQQARLLAESQDLEILFAVSTVLKELDGEVS